MLRVCALPLSEVTFLPATRFSFGVTLKSTEDAHPSFRPNSAWGSAHKCAADADYTYNTGTFAFSMPHQAPTENSKRSN
ncbi:MAG: hypothetical protein KME19_20340 [Microcoleus vaginatus WJT46-NPBG5]|nr:hypothetical protein [Microcoleus vaginatus WJT46-NPBG5]